MLGEAGLSGRGGAGFPSGRKMASVTGRKPVVVGNGSEGEPLSRKDAQLLTRAPHLVLDGLSAAAAAIGADKVYLYLHADAAPTVDRALDERRAAGLDPNRVVVVEAPDSFVAGEESAAIRRIEGGPALPRDRTVLATVSGVRGRPTLVNNVETLAHMALIARFGSEWFRSVGDADDPGTMLVTYSGALRTHGVVEVPTGTLLTGLLEHTGDTDPDNIRAVLVGGYHGSWLPSSAFAGTRLSRSGLKALGASPGAGIVHALGHDERGLARTPLLMLTANAMADHVEAGRLAGADGHLGQRLGIMQRQHFIGRGRLLHVDEHQLELEPGARQGNRMLQRLQRQFGTVNRDKQLHIQPPVRPRGWRLGHGYHRPGRARCRQGPGPVGPGQRQAP